MRLKEEVRAILETAGNKKWRLERCRAKASREALAAVERAGGWTYRGVQGAYWTVCGEGTTVPMTEPVPDVVVRRPSRELGIPEGERVPLGEECGVEEALRDRV